MFSHAIQNCGEMFQAKEQSMFNDKSIFVLNLMLKQATQSNNCYAPLKLQLSVCQYNKFMDKRKNKLSTLYTEV